MVRITPDQLMEICLSAAKDERLDLTDKHKERMAQKCLEFEPYVEVAEEELPEFRRNVGFAFVAAARLTQTMVAQMLFKNW